ncbi:MAG: radical SAM protein [Candidatus Aenigmarchaeota archaeon]|nr:radical SAM protein [Candidatus Aenigmarchaeota archaeon]
MKLRVLKNYAKTILFGKEMYVLFRVTHRCNFRCKMCSVWKQKIPELDLEQIQKIADILKKTNVSIINIGGGEPLVRKDIVDIVKIFSKDFEVRMQTNAYMANEKLIKELVDAGLKNVSISLDTLDPEKFDHICNSKGGFEKLKKNAALFAKYLPKRGSLMLFNACVSKENIHELSSLTKFANKMGFVMGFSPVLLAESSDKKNAFRDYSPDMKLKGNHETSKIIKKIIDMKKEGYKIFSSYDALTKMDLFFRGDFDGKWNCDIGSLYFQILPNGDITPCSELFPVGNIFKEGLDCLKPELMEKMKKTCNGCLHPCWFETSQLVRNRKVFREKFWMVLDSYLHKRK